MIKISRPKQFNFSECLWFLDRNLDDCMHTVIGNKVRKLIAINESPVLFDVFERDANLIIEVLYGKINDTQPLIAFVEDWFDLNRRISPFYKLLRKDPDLRPLLNYSGFHMVGIPDFFETLCWCVVGQQINLSFAYKLKRKLAESYGQYIVFEKKKYYLFPKPEVMQHAGIEALKAMQLTTRKAEYISGIATLFVNGTLSKEKMFALGNEALMLTELLKVRGIGEWTANYALMKCLRAMDCVPYGDSGVNNALLKFKGIEKDNNRQQVDAFFDKFTGWKTYLVFYLWRSLREK